MKVQQISALSRGRWKPAGGHFLLFAAPAQPHLHHRSSRTIPLARNVIPKGIV